MAGFPNLFTLLGPNTGLGHNSIVYMIESQLNYMLDALRLIEQRGIARFEVRPEVQRAYNADLQRRLAGAVWSSWRLRQLVCRRARPQRRRSGRVRPGASGG